MSIDNTTYESDFEGDTMSLKDFEDEVFEDELDEIDDEIEEIDDEDDLSDLLAEFNISQNADGSIDTGIKYLHIDSFRVVVHKAVLEAMDNLFESHSHVEYGLYLKGYFDPDQNIYYVDKDIYVPAQNVTSSTIEFTEGRPSLDFTTAIHKHPEGVYGFSGTDETSINVNFECSLLYTKERGIFLASICIGTDMQGVSVRFKTNKIKIYYPENAELTESKKNIRVLRVESTGRSGPTGMGLLSDREKTLAGYRDGNRMLGTGLTRPLPLSKYNK